MANNDDAAARRRAKRGETPGDSSPESTPAEPATGADAQIDAASESREAASVALGGEPTKSGGPRLLNFFRASWAELQRVRWPTGQQVAQGTAVTLGFVVIAGAFLGFADVVARQIVNLII